MLRLVLCLCALLSLSACFTVQSPTATSQTARISGAPQVVSAQHARSLNGLRAQFGLSALTPDATLARIASGHARDMTRNGFFGHISSNGDTIVERTRAQGYAFCHIAENLARGQRSFETVLGQWMTSPTHRTNLMNPEVTGFALVRAPGDLWVLVMGTPGC